MVGNDQFQAEPAGLPGLPPDWRCRNPRVDYHIDPGFATLLKGCDIQTVAFFETDGGRKTRRSLPIVSANPADRRPGNAIDIVIAVDANSLFGGDRCGNSFAGFGQSGRSIRVTGASRRAEHPETSGLPRGVRFVDSVGVVR